MSWSNTPSFLLFFFVFSSSQLQADERYRKLVPPTLIPLSQLAKPGEKWNRCVEGIYSSMKSAPVSGDPYGLKIILVTQGISSKTVPANIRAIVVCPDGELHDHLHSATVAFPHITIFNSFLKNSCFPMDKVTGKFKGADLFLSIGDQIERMPRERNFCSR